LRWQDNTKAGMSEAKIHHRRKKSCK